MILSLLSADPIPDPQDLKVGCSAADIFETKLSTRILEARRWVFPSGLVGWGCIEPSGCRSEGVRDTER